MKKFIALFAIIFAATFANAAYVKWSVTGADTVADFSYASLAYYTTSDTELTILHAYKWSDGSESINNSKWTEGATTAQAAYIDALTDYSNVTFVAVAYNQAGDKIWLSDTVAGTTLGGYIMNDKAGTIPDFAKDVMVFSMGEAIPEPTSGLMLVLGLAILGLKRKQA